MYYKRLAKKYGIFLQDKNGEKIKNIGWLNGIITERLRKCDFKKLCYITKIECVRNNNKDVDSFSCSSHRLYEIIFSQTEVFLISPCDIFTHLRVKASVWRVYINELDVGSQFASLRMSQ